MTSTTTPLIRFAHLTDLNTLTDLAKQLGYCSTSDQIRSRLEELQSRSDENAILVAELGEHVVGWVHAHIYRLLVDDPEVEIGGLVVDENVRGQRIGKALMYAAEDWAHERGCTSVYLRSNTIRTRAHKFYKDIGYEIIKSQYAMRKKLR